VFPHYWKKNEDMIMLIWKVPVFQKLNKNSISSAWNFGEILKFTQGDKIYRKGEENKFIYVVIQGELEIQTSILDTEKKSQTELYLSNRSLIKPKKKALLKLYRGDYFGDESGYGASTMLYEIEVKSHECTLFRFLKSVFIIIIDRNS